MAEYNSFAGSFAQTRKKHWPDIDELISSIPREKFLGQILDIGCGSGRLCEYLPDFSESRYKGVDVSSEMIRIAQSNYPNAQFSCMDMLDIGQLGQPVDILFFIASLQHICTIEDQIKILTDAYSLLNPGGYIALLNWNLLSEKTLKKYPPITPESSLRYIPFQGYNRTYFAIQSDELDRCLKSANFVDIKTILSSTEMNFLTIAKR